MHSTDLQWGVPLEFNAILDDLLDGGQGMMNEEEYQISLNQSLSHAFAPETGIGSAAHQDHDEHNTNDQMLSEVEEKESPLTTQTEEKASEKSIPNMVEGTATPKGTPDRKSLMMQVNNAAGSATVKATTKRVEFQTQDDNGEMIFAQIEQAE